METIKLISWLHGCKRLTGSRRTSPALASVYQVSTKWTVRDLEVMSADVFSFFVLLFSLEKRTFPSSHQELNPAICSPACQSHHNPLWNEAPLKHPPFSYPTVICFLQLCHYLRVRRGLRCPQWLSCLPTMSRERFPNLRCWKIQSLITSTSRTFRRRSLHPTYPLGNRRLRRSLERFLSTGRGLSKILLRLSVGKCRRRFRMCPTVRPDYLPSQWH